MCGFSGIPLALCDLSRARDSMGNRVSSGSTGDYSVEVFNEYASSFSDEDQEYTSPVSIGQAVYTRQGEYTATYNVTTVGEYSLNVSKHVERNPGVDKVCSGNLPIQPSDKKKAGGCLYNSTRQPICVNVLSAWPSLMLSLPKQN